ncbi:flavin reductase [bacterium]|nr:flavin reductase [bacterium]
MARQTVTFDQLLVHSQDLWANQWMLLTSGDFLDGSFNCMTIAWGSLGNMWNRPFAQVVVRPNQFAYDFIERYETFTLCAFPSEYRGSLEMIGSVSGSSRSKITEAGLTPVASSVVAAPAYSEAELVLECQKIYWDDINPAHFLDSGLNAHYPNQDYHRIYYGEVIAIVHK